MDNFGSSIDSGVMPGGNLKDSATKQTLNRDAPVRREFDRTTKPHRSLVDFLCDWIAAACAYGASGLASEPAAEPE